MRTAVIELEGRFVDNITPGAEDAADAVRKVGKEADKAEKEVDSFGKKKARPTIDADNSKFLRKMRESESKAARLAGKTFSATMKLIDKTTSTVNKIESGLKSVTKKTWSVAVKIKDYATAPLRGIKNMLFSVKSLVMAITAGLAAKQFIMNPISLADAYSSAQIGFQTLLGDTRGQKLMNDLDQFAKATPFSSAQVIAQTQRMVAMGWDVDNIIDDMTTIGDAAAATGKGEEGLQRIVTALAQIKAKGKLSTEELNQLAEAGISAKRYIAEGLGYGSGDEGLAAMTADLEKGAIAAGDALKALMGGMQEYKGMMDSTANNTVTGIWSQITDTFEINIFRRWGQGLQEGAKKGFGTVLDLLNKSESALESLGDMLFEAGKKLSNWAVDKLQNLVEKITALTDTMEWQNAGFGGKVKILWEVLVADPIKEWWNNGGKEKTVETAGKVGKFIGEAMKTGIMALLGVTDLLKDGGIDESSGMSVAQSFAKGFVEGFDVSAITDKLVEAISNVWNALPSWAKIALGIYGGSKVAGGIGMLGKGLSAVGNGAKALWNFGGTAATMFGLGKAATAATAAGAGTAAAGAGTAAAAGTAATVGAGATLAGLGGVAGGIVGAGSAISGGIDIYNGIKNNDKAATQSGWLKIGGTALGALAGFALGGPVGAAIGAGIGGGAAWFGGNAIKNNAAEEAASATEEYIAHLNELEQSEAEAAAEAAKLLQENKKLAAENMAKHFGDVTLSAEEMQEAIRNIIGDEFFYETDAVVSAIDQMNSSFTALENQSRNLKKSVWKFSVTPEGKLDSSTIEALRDEAIAYGDSVQTYLSDAQYASKESIESILGLSKDSEDAQKVLSNSTKYYNKQSAALDKLSTSLNRAIREATSEDSEGGITISVNEKETIDTIRSQMDEIVRQIQEDEYEAEVNILKAKYLGDLTPEGFGDMMAGLAEQNAALAETYWDAFGRASVGQSEEAIETLRKGTLDKLAGMWANTGDIGLGTFRETVGTELDILGEDLKTMFGNNTYGSIIAAAEGMDGPLRQEISDFMAKLEPTTSEIQALADAYKKAGMEIPESISNYLQSVEFYEALAKGPEAVEAFLNGQEIEWAVNAKIINPDLSNYWNELDLNQAFSIEANVTTEWHYDEFNEQWISPDGQYKFTTEGLVAANWTYDSFNEKWISPDEKYTFTTDADIKAQYHIAEHDTSAVIGYQALPDPLDLMTQTMPVEVIPEIFITNAFDKDGDGYIDPVSIGDKITESIGTFEPTEVTVPVIARADWQMAEDEAAVDAQIKAAIGLDEENGYGPYIAPVSLEGIINVTDESKFKGEAIDFGIEETYTGYETEAKILADYPLNKFSPTRETFGIANSYSYDVPVKINTVFSRGTLLQKDDDDTPGFSTGGIVQGGAKLIKVAEEGDPEMIIPLGSQRRERGLKLWSKAGEMLGVPGFARGGRTDGRDEGLRFHRYGSDEQSTGQTVQVDVGGVTVEINVHASEGQTVAEAIREQAGEIAETVAGILDDAYRAQFENTPVRGGVA